jgi:hypothetical protein
MVVLSGIQSALARTMHQSTFDRSLRTLVRRKPFKPFMVELTSGSHFMVEHPEALAFYNGLGVYLATDGELMLFDHHTVARLVGNGKARD